MRISDWSSDVCSSDLQGVLPEDVGVARNLDHDGDDRRPSLGCAELSVLIVTLCPCDTEAVGGGADHAGDLDRNMLRSEERRVGKEGVSKCRSRWSTYTSKQNKHQAG